MARTRINDIPENEKLDKKLMKQIFGGPTAVEYAVMLARYESTPYKQEGQTNIKFSLSQPQYYA